MYTVCVEKEFGKEEEGRLLGKQKETNNEINNKGVSLKCILVYLY